MLDHQHGQTHNIEHVEVPLPPQAIDNDIEFIDLVSPYDDDGDDKAVDSILRL